MHLYVISEPDFTENSYINVTLNINKRRRLRNMNSQITIKLENNKDNDINRIKDYTTNLDNNAITNANIIEIEKTAVLDNNIINFNDIIYPVNMYNIDTEKVQELISNGYINFTEKYLDKNYTTNIYKFQNISQGCEFSIITDKNINNNKKSIDITTQFIEYSTSDIIDINCTLIPSNNIIKCKSNQELNNYYTPKDFIYYDEDELFIIFNENKEEAYNLLCNINPIGIDNKSDEPIVSTISNAVEPNDSDSPSSSNYIFQGNNKTSGSSSTGMLIGIIAGSIAFIVCIILTIFCLRKKCRKNPEDGSDSRSLTKSEVTSDGTRSDLDDTTDENKKLFRFKTTAGIITDIFMNPDKNTIKDLIKKFFKRTKQPKLYKDKEIGIVFCAVKIDENIKKKKISKFLQENYCAGVPLFVILDPKTKIQMQ